MMKQKDMPDWALKHKKKGTQIIESNGNFYLYKITSKWDPEKKRAKKITEKYLGKITKDGLVPPKHERVKEKYEQISIKEFGATYFLKSISKDVLNNLKKVYPYEYKELFVLSAFRLTEQSPLKNIRTHYTNSYLSESLPEARTSPKFLGKFLKDIGERKKPMKEFMNKFAGKGKHAVIDMTNVFTYSKGVSSAMLGYNKDKKYIPQVNLVLIYSLDDKSPVYFRQVPGSIKDVSTVVNTVRESEAGKIVLIGDRGTYSKKNRQELKKDNIDYLFSIRRNSKDIDYGKVIENDRKKFDGYLVYNKRHVWFYSYKKGDDKIITFIDNNLKSEEEDDMAIRIKSLEGKDLDEKQKRQLKKCRTRLFEEPHKNGTLSVRTSLDKDPEEIYQLLKSRVDVEKVFDIFKNILKADKSYMRTDSQLRGWFFVNLISMQMYYKIYSMLLEKKMLDKYSPMDVLLHLKRVQKFKIGDKWKIAEIPKKSRKVIKKLNVDIPIT